MSIWERASGVVGAAAKSAGMPTVAEARARLAAIGNEGLVRLAAAIEAAKDANAVTVKVPLPTAVASAPVLGGVLMDARGGGRALKVTWHEDLDVVVLSVWRENVCTASSRLAREDVPELIEALSAGLEQPSAAEAALG